MLAVICLFFTVLRYLEFWQWRYGGIIDFFFGGITVSVVKFDGIIRYQCTLLEAPSRGLAFYTGHVAERFKTRAFYSQGVWFKTSTGRLWKVPENHVPRVNPNHVREIWQSVGVVADETHDGAIVWRLWALIAPILPYMNWRDVPYPFSPQAVPRRVSFYDI